MVQRLRVHEHVLPRVRCPGCHVEMWLVEVLRKFEG